MEVHVVSPRPDLTAEAAPASTARLGSLLLPTCARTCACTCARARACACARTCGRNLRPRGLPRPLSAPPRQQKKSHLKLLCEQCGFY